MREEPSEEARWVRRAAAGDACALTRLVEQHRGAAVATALHVLGASRAEDARDAAQEALIEVCLHLSELRDPARFGPYLRQATVNRCRDLLRRGRHGDISLGELTDAGREPAAPGLAPDERAALRLTLDAALSRLSARTRETLLLSCACGHSPAEVARFLGVPVNTVRRRLQIARAALRKEEVDMTTQTLGRAMPGPGWTEATVRAALSRAEAALRRHERAEAIRSYDEALSALDAAPPHDTAARRLALTALRDKERALPYTQGAEENVALLTRASELAREAADDRAEADALQGLGAAYARRRERTASEEHYHAAREIYRRLGDEGRQGECLLFPAAGALFAGEVEAARTLIGSAAEHFTQAGVRDYGAVCGALDSLLGEAAGERFGRLALWRAVGEVVEKRGRALRLGAQPGFQSTRPGAGLPPAFTAGAVFRQVSHLGVFLDGDVPVGGGWSGPASSFGGSPLHAAVTVLGDRERVTTPAGGFARCLLTEQVTASPVEDGTPPLDRALLCGTRRAWWAPGVGLVRLDVERNDGVTARIELNAYSVPPGARNRLPLAVGNSWTYGWVGDLGGWEARETYAVTATAGRRWYLAHHAWVAPPP